MFEYLFNSVLQTNAYINDKCVSFSYIGNIDSVLILCFPKVVEVSSKEPNLIYTFI